MEVVSLWNLARKLLRCRKRPGCTCSRSRRCRAIRGQSGSLGSRVRSYFLESRWMDAKTGSLVREIADLETIVVDNEREALALENNLIKRYHPKFNVLLRDDRPIPTSSSRRLKNTACVFHPAHQKDGSLYFGRIFRADWRAASCISFTSASWFQAARSIWTRNHPRPACSITFRYPQACAANRDTPACSKSSCSRGSMRSSAFPIVAAALEELRSASRAGSAYARPW